MRTLLVALALTLPTSLAAQEAPTAWTPEQVKVADLLSCYSAHMLLGHRWTGRIFFVDYDTIPGHEDWMASVGFDTEYWSADFLLDVDLPHIPEYEQRRVVVHELLHLIFAPAEDFLKDEDPEEWDRFVNREVTRMERWPLWQGLCQSGDPALPRR